MTLETSVFRMKGHAVGKKSKKEKKDKKDKKAAKLAKAAEAVEAPEAGTADGAEEVPETEGSPKGERISKSEKRDAKLRKIKKKEAEAAAKAAKKGSKGKGQKGKRKGKSKSIVASPGADLERRVLASDDDFGGCEAALSEEFYNARREELVSRVSAKRLRHIDAVAETAVALAATYGVDQRKARLAGLLHDWDKGYDDAGIRARAAEVGLDVPAIVLQDMPQTLHGMTASLALGRDFPEIPKDVLQAVYRHTSGAVGMSPLDMVVYIADCTEPGRKIDIVEELRGMVGEVSLEELFFRTHGVWMTMVVRRSTTLLPETIDVWNHYALRHRARRDAERAAAGLPPRSVDPNSVQGA